MLQELDLELLCEDGKSMNFQKSSALHGVLMEQIDPEYGEILHKTGLKPYSLCLVKENDSIHWKIRSFTEKAGEQIIQPLFSESFDKFYIRNGNIRVQIKEKIQKKISIYNLMEHASAISSPCYYSIDFQTPTAFKSKGKYIFHPEIHYLYQSLINKYFSCYSEAFFEKNLLETLVEKSQIIQYDLKSTYFHLEGVKVPSFLGSITIKLNASKQESRAADFLFCFGNFSGIGIKTSIGMGAVQIKKNEKIELP